MFHEGVYGNLLSACFAVSAPASNLIHFRICISAIPKILNVSANQVVTQGEEVQLVCLAEGRPAPTVTWTRVADGARVKPSFRIRGRKDKAKYKCTASNGVGAPAVAYTELDVQCKLGRVCQRRR